MTIMQTRDPNYTTTATGDGLIEEIIRNKRLDLWLEGQGFLDMKRLGRVPDRLPAKNFDILGSLAGSTAKERALLRNIGESAEKIPKTVDDINWEFAIPYDEIKAYPTIAINPL